MELATGANARSDRLKASRPMQQLRGLVRDRAAKRSGRSELLLHGGRDSVQQQLRQQLVRDLHQGLIVREMILPHLAANRFFFQVDSDEGQLLNSRIESVLTAVSIFQNNEEQ